MKDVRKWMRKKERRRRSEKGGERERNFRRPMQSLRRLNLRQWTAAIIINYDENTPSPPLPITSN